MDPEVQRERLEGALSDVELRTLLDSCRAMGVDPASWLEIDTTRRFFETVAVLRRVRYLLRTFDISETRAYERAGEYFGVNGETIRRNITRWREADRQHRRTYREAA